MGEAFIFGSSGGSGASTTLTAIAGEDIMAGDAIEYYAYPGVQDLTDPIVHTNVLAISPNGRYRVEYSSTAPYFLVYDGDTLLPYAEGEAPGSGIYSMSGHYGFFAAFSSTNNYLMIKRFTASHSGSLYYDIYAVGEQLTLVNSRAHALASSSPGDYCTIECVSPVGDVFITTQRSGDSLQVTKFVVAEGAVVETTYSRSSSPRTTGISAISGDGNVFIVPIYSSYTYVLKCEMNTGVFSVFRLPIVPGSSYYYSNYIIGPVNYDGSVFLCECQYGESFRVCVVSGSSIISSVSLPNTGNPTSGSFYGAILPTTTPNLYRVLAATPNVNCFIETDENNAVRVVASSASAPAALPTGAPTGVITSPDKSRAYIHRGGTFYEVLFGDAAVVRKLGKISDAQYRAMNAYGWHGIGYAQSSANAGQEVKIKLLTDISDAMRGNT